MGSDISIDKHTTQIQEWLEVESKLENVDFNSEISNHLGMWKIFPDDKSKGELNTIPILMDSHNTAQLLEKKDCYVLYAIKRSNYQNPEVSCTNLGSILAICFNKIAENMLELSYRNPMKSGVIDGHEYRVYAFLGKQSKAKSRLLATSYALRFADVLNSKKKLGILSGGGVIRNKKLQKGSKLELSWSDAKNSPNSNPSIINNQPGDKVVDVFDFFNSKGFSQKKSSKNSFILKMKSSTQTPCFKSEQRSSHNRQEKSASVGEPRVAPKKAIIEKMNLKLDFSKPLSLQQKKKSGDSNNSRTQIPPNQIESLGMGLTNRSQERRGKREKCNLACSQVIEGLYVSGEKVAKDIQLLREHKIEAIVNCAGDYCENWFEKDGSITYLTFFLKDSQNESIQCLFYRVIDFIQECQKEKKNVLIHCIQGISRSVTFVIAYIIFKYGYDYKKAQSFVKQKRMIACPNNGFMVELIQFHKRLYEDYSSLISPRVYLVSSHSRETPSIFTARLLKMPLYDGTKCVRMDSRGMYIVHTVEALYIWVGSGCGGQKLEKYSAYANQFIKKLQKYQRAPIKVKTIKQGSEDQEFLGIWSLNEALQVYENPEYDRFFQDPNSPTSKAGLQRQYYEQVDEEEEECESVKNICKLYIYPNYQQGLGVFSDDDFGSDCKLTILVETCRIDELESGNRKGVDYEGPQGNLKVYIWKNNQEVITEDISSEQESREKNSESERSISSDESIDEKFLRKVIEANYSDYDDSDIEVFQEISGWDFLRRSNKGYSETRRIKRKHIFC